MTQPTNYQLVKLGANLEFMRGVCAASLRPTSDLANFPNLMENSPARRYSVVRVVGVLKSLLIQFQEMGLEQSLLAAEAFQPMIKEMEDYLQQANATEYAFLNDSFAERLIALSKQVSSTVRSELNQVSPPALETKPQDQPA